MTDTIKFIISEGSNAPLIKAKEQAHEVTNTERGSGGFGSMGEYIYVIL
ncbi:MAG: hypothetical protein ACTTJM_00055 [Bergeyella cardium]